MKTQLSSFLAFAASITFLSPAHARFGDENDCCKEVTKTFSQKSDRVKVSKTSTKNGLTEKELARIKEIKTEISELKKEIAAKVQTEPMSLAISDAENAIFIDSSSSLLNNEGFSKAKAALGLLAEYAPIGTALSVFTMLDYNETESTVGFQRQVLSKTEITDANRASTAAQLRAGRTAGNAAPGLADSLLRSVEFALENTTAKTLVFITDGFFDAGHDEGRTTPTEDFETARQLASEKGVELRIILVGGIDQNLLKHLDSTQAAPHMWLKDVNEMSPSPELLKLTKQVEDLKREKTSILQGTH